MILRAESKVLLLSIAWLLLQPAMAAGANTTTEPDSDSESKATRPVKYADSLLVNTSNSERYVVEGKSEADGIRDIQSILKRSGFEEMWVYLPAAGQWHEIGRDEISDVQEAYVGVDWSYLESLIAENSELSLYHFHPLAYFKCGIHAGCAPPSAPTESSGLRDTRLISDVKFSMPSPADIHFMMEITWQFHQHHPDGGSIQHKVVTPHGIVDYALTDAGLAKYASDRGARTQGLYIKWVAASQMADESIQSIVDENPEDIKSALGRLVEDLNTRYLRVTYFPND